MGKPSKGDQLQQKSPAEFFAENKNIAGFDNVRHALWHPASPLVHTARAMLVHYCERACRELA